jgi:hypothetical protein
MATVVYSRNPLNPADREVHCLQGSLASMAPKTNLPFLCLLNGVPTLRKDWDMEPQESDLVVFATLLQGGGGGGKNPLRLIATIALAVYAPQLAGAAGFGAAGTAALTAGIQIAGTLAINAVLPAPKLPSSQQTSNLSAPSPTYSLGSQANTARLGAAVPVLYGRHLIYPDLADQPLVYNPSPKVQNLVQMFLVGQGTYTLSDYKIEDTPIENFKASEIFPLGPDQPDVLGEDTGIFNVAEVAGQELLPPDEGANQWLGPFVISPPDKQISRIHVEVTFSRGLGFANDAGGLSPRTVTWVVEVQPIDEFGLETDSWIELGAETATFADNAVLRISEFYDLAPARYQVRLARTSAKDASIRVSNDILWTGCAGISNAAPTDFVQSTTRLQVVLQASDNLNNNTARRFNLIAQRRLLTWHPETGWSAEEEESRSIVWAFVDVLRLRGVPDSRIALDELYALDQFYKARRMFFDGVFDNKIGMFEALTLIARAGRAVPMRVGGKFTMIRDSQRTLAVSKFGMRNIRRGSFSMSFDTVTEETPNAVVVDYVDQDTFKPKQIKVIQAGSAGDVIQRVQLFGVTDPVNAENEAKYLLADIRYRRRMVSFSTEMDGFICRFGDPVLVSHDLPKWGFSGEVESFDELTGVLGLSEAVVFGSGAHYIRFARKNGSVTLPYLVTAGANKFEVILDEPLDLDDEIYTGGEYERTRFSFGGSLNSSRLCKVTSLRPRGFDSVEVSVVVDDARVYEESNDLETYVVEQAAAVYAPEEFEGTYSTATSEERAAFAFWANDRGLLNNDAAYIYQTEV